MADHVTLAAKIIGMQYITSSSVAGVTGVYIQTCRKVLKVLREHGVLKAMPKVGKRPIHYERVGFISEKCLTALRSLK